MRSHHRCVSRFTGSFCSIVIGLSGTSNMEVFRMDHNFQNPSASGSANPLKLEASRRQVLAVGGISLGALLLAACTNSPSGSAGPEQSGGTPKKGGTLRISISDASTSDTLDPGTGLTANASIAVKAVYDPLAVTDQDFKAQPALAS